MCLYKNPSELNKLSMLSLYRLLIKNIKYYPSKNRFNIELAIREGIIIFKKNLEQIRKFQMKNNYWLN